jgi:hypothetical protein
VSRRRLALLRPFLRYSLRRDAFVLRCVGRRVGPVLCLERRERRGEHAFAGAERRAPSVLPRRTRIA